MTIELMKLYRYSLPFIKPVRLGNRSHTIREGLVIELIDSSGHSGWGECAPLPFFSKETLAESLDQLSGLKRKIASGSFEADDILGLTIGTYPSVSFVIESALNNLIEFEEENEQPVAVRINGLITDQADPILTARQLVDDGYSSIKVKVGRQGIEEDAQIVRAIADILPEGVTLRLDANRAWSLYDAKRFCDAVRSLPVEYIEEPLNDSRRLSQLAELSPVPIALDESLRELDGGTLFKTGRFKAIVLKPTLTGGPTIIRKLVVDARRMNMTIVISSSYETGVGLNSLARLAADIAPDNCHGLDTSSLFETDLITTPLSPAPALIQSVLPRKISIDRTLLTEVTDD